MSSSDGLVFSEWQLFYSVKGFDFNATRGHRNIEIAASCINFTIFIAFLSFFILKIIVETLKDKVVYEINVGKIEKLESNTNVTTQQLENGDNNTATSSNNANDNNEFHDDKKLENYIQQDWYEELHNTIRFALGRGRLIYVSFILSGLYFFYETLASIAFVFAYQYPLYSYSLSRLCYAMVTTSTGIYIASFLFLLVCWRLYFVSIRLEWNKEYKRLRIKYASDIVDILRATSSCKNDDEDGKSENCISLFCGIVIILFAILSLVLAFPLVNIFLQEGAIRYQVHLYGAMPSIFLCLFLVSVLSIINIIFYARAYYESNKKITEIEDKIKDKQKAYDEKVIAILPYALPSNPPKITHPFSNGQIKRGLVTLPFMQISLCIKAIGFMFVVLSPWSFIPNAYVQCVLLRIIPNISYAIVFLVLNMPCCIFIKLHFRKSKLEIKEMIKV